MDDDVKIVIQFRDGKPYVDYFGKDINPEKLAELAYLTHSGSLENTFLDNAEGMVLMIYQKIKEILANEEPVVSPLMAFTNEGNVK